MSAKNIRKVELKDKAVKNAKQIKGGPIYMQFDHGMLVPAVQTQLPAVQLPGALNFGK